MLEELWRRYKYEMDVNAREELIVKCLPLVKSLAQRFAIYTSPCCDVDDLISAGVTGLLDALEKYDSAVQANFKTYATFRIRGAILDEIRNSKWAPRSIQEKIRNLQRVYNRLEQILSRPPTEEELSCALGMSLDQFHRMLIQIGPSTIFAGSQKEAEDSDLGSWETSVGDPSAVNPIDQIISEETRSILANAIRSLSEKEKIVISLYYYEEMTMREIGEVLSLTESRICQIHARAILNLFQALRRLREAPLQMTAMQ